MAIVDVTFDESVKSLRNNFISPGVWVFVVKPLFSIYIYGLIEFILS